MQKHHLRTLLLLGCLIALTCTAMAYSKGHNPIVPDPGSVQAKNGIVHLRGNLTQGKVLYQSDGKVGLSLTMTADDIITPEKGPTSHVDMVIVLDRSGSMQGQKLDHAKKAILNLLENLTPQDRFALVSYANTVQLHTGLLPATTANRKNFADAIHGIMSGGGTNLGAGLQEGINLFAEASGKGNLGKVILISDGLANQGITDPVFLGKMAARAANMECSLSTVGVGVDFNEYLMTSLADHGTGYYYFLENPNAFASVFQKEFNNTRMAAATSVEIHIPLPTGANLLEAAGYPIEYRHNEAIFRPGDILSGQSRKLILTMQVPTDRETTIDITGINVRYLHNGTPYTVALEDSLQIACARNRQAVFASIDKNVWEEKVLKEDYNKLKDQVAHDIKSGKKEAAMKRIDEYKTEQEAVNRVVGSAEVAVNLADELDALRGQVKETFAGAPSAVALKQKKVSKALQYKSYEGRRAVQ